MNNKNNLIFKSSEHFEDTISYCKKILGCSIQSDYISTIEYFNKIKKYLSNKSLINSERFLLATEALFRTYLNFNIITSPKFLNINEKRLGHRVENKIINSCIGFDDINIKRFIEGYIKKILPDAIIHGILPTFDGPCNDISYLLEINEQKFIFPIEIKSTNRNSMSFLGNKSLTGPCGLVLIVGYDYVFKYDHINIKCMALLSPTDANFNMKKTWKTQKIHCSYSIKYIHDFIDDKFEKYLCDNNLWYGIRPTYYCKEILKYNKYCDYAPIKYHTNKYNYENRSWNNKSYHNVNNNSSSSMNWRKPNNIRTY